MFGGSLARHGIAWVDFGGFRWKLNLANPTHRWLVYREYEELAVSWLLQRILLPDSVVVDSGANIGQMVLMYLWNGPPARVFAFEPTPAAREWLEECVAENSLRSVHVSSVALGETARSARLIAHDFGFKEGAQNQVADGGEGLEIEITTLDAVAVAQKLESIRFWKLDTEGHELPALKGAVGILERAAIDYLYVETADAGPAICAFLEARGYAPVTLQLDRRLTTAEACARFTNLFVSPRVAQMECKLR